MLPRLAPLLAISILATLAIWACDSGGGGGDGGEGAVWTPPPPEPADEMLDDLEDGDLEFAYSDGQGYWRAPSAGVAADFEVADSGADGTARALHATIGAEGGRGTLVADLHQQSDGVVSHDYSVCSGIELWARSATGAGATAWLTLESASGLSRVELALSEDWQAFEFDWGAFEPDQLAAGGAGGAGGASGSASVLPASAGAAGGGGAGDAGGAGGAAGGVGSNEPPVALTPGELDVHTIRSVRVEQSGDLDLWVDQLTLKNCVLRYSNPPLPEPPELGSTAPAGSPVARHGQLRVAGTQLLDQNGDPVQLKGVSSMWLNWESSGYAESREALEWMRDNWNLTVIRASMGVEPGGAFLTDPRHAREQVTRIVENALALGVYVIIDWHDHNAHQHAAQSEAFFSQMAQRYGAYPNVIYEPYNEPLAVSWSTVLKPYHEGVVAAIRAFDPDNPIVLGTPQWSQQVDDAARDPVRANNIMYALHFYSCTHSGWLRDAAQVALGRGVALFVTEWGATHADGGRDGLTCEGEATTWLAWMEQYNISWTAWKLDDCIPDTTCLLAVGAPLEGGWTDEYLYGHAPLVREWMLR